MSLEGVYSPEDGRMYLIGCRSIDAPWRVASASRDDLEEDGMDCSVEVVVEYQPTTTRWLVSPAAKLYIASTRDANDPLYFDRTELRSPPINYRDPRDVLTEHTVVNLLCVAMLSAAVAATASQMRYVKSHPDVAPYVSLAMLGVQARWDTGWRWSRTPRCCRRGRTTTACSARGICTGTLTVPSERSPSRRCSSRRGSRGR
jgi:hypothetical protein